MRNNVKCLHSKKQVAQDGAVAVSLASSEFINAQETWSRQRLALLQAQSSLGELGVGNGLQTGLHKPRAQPVLADHLHDGSATSGLPDLPAEPHPSFACVCHTRYRFR